MVSPLPPLDVTWNNTAVPYTNIETLKTIACELYNVVTIVFSPGIDKKN
jgi:hypothetical protein